MYSYLYPDVSIDEIPRLSSLLVRTSWICGSVGQLCGDRRNVREGRSAP